jgi:tetratricopeptide (TPR) repeat protein
MAQVASLVFVAGEARADDAPQTLAAVPDIATSRDEPSVRALVTAEPPQAKKQHIEKLIRQLGDPRYTLRRAAATELRQIGPEAFDLLHAATSDSDPEVAASARYLLRQIAVRWVQSDDSPAVRSILRDYDRQSENVRLKRIQELARLADGEGAAGLCRVARFDRSPQVSRIAALAIIRPVERSAPTARIDPEVVERELGESTRVAAVWLRRYLVQLQSLSASVQFWRTAVDDEVARLQESPADTSAEIVSGLLWNLADVYRQLDNRSEMTGVINRMIGVNPDELEETSIELLEWMTKYELWTALDEFLAKHGDQLEQSKRSLYHAALARAAQGKADEAEQLAEKAAQLESQAALEHFITAKDLEEHNQFDWAVREYRRAIDDQKIASHEGILSRLYLASLLHDYEQHAEAAKVLEPLAAAVKNQGQVGQLYAELERYYDDRLDLPETDAVSGRAHYYRACQYNHEGNHQREREALELAIKLDPMNADVLIAMYRLPEADEKWREDVRQRIRNLCRDLQQKIDDNPNESDFYNQWAWLVGNTEGDYQKAIRYSHRSLELIPPGSGQAAGASFLDTLGRCYYAVGDLENALKYQRQAIEKVDYMQVMRRQLALFEKAAAEKQGARSEERGASETD